MKRAFYTFGILCALMIGAPVDITLPVTTTPPAVRDLPAPWEIDIHVEQLPFAARTLSGDIHCAVDKATEQVVRITISSPLLKVDGEALDTVRGEILMNIPDHTLIVKKLELGKLQLKGKVNLARQELDLSGEFKGLPIEQLCTALSGASALSGEADGSIRIQGSWDSLSYKGSLNVRHGELRGFSFDEALFNFSGNYPYFTLNSSYVENNDGRYALEGIVGIDDLADAGKIDLQVFPEKLVIDGWSISQDKGIGSGTANFSRNNGSAFSVGRDTADRHADDPEAMGVAFKKALGAANFFKVKIEHSASALLVGRQVEF